MDIFEAQVSCCGVPGFDNVEEVGVRSAGEKGVGGGCRLPELNPIRIEVGDWVAFDGGHWGGVGVRKVEVIFYGREEGEEVFFELQADEFFGAHVAHCFRAAGILLVPGVVDGLGEEVDPSPVGG